MARVVAETNGEFFGQRKRERVLRKTETHELIERTFTTEPKYRRRIRRGHTIVIERCKDVMEGLWQDGYRKKCTKKDLDRMVFLCAGGDKRTIRKYIGYYRTRARRYVPGYLQRLGYIEKITGHGLKAIYILNHFKVNRSYHYQQTRIPSKPPLSSSDECVESKEKMFVCKGCGEEHTEGMENGDVETPLVVDSSSSSGAHTQNSRVKVKKTVTRVTGEERNNGDLKSFSEKKSRGDLARGVTGVTDEGGITYIVDYDLPLSGEENVNERVRFYRDLTKLKNKFEYEGKSSDSVLKTRDRKLAFKIHDLAVSYGGLSTVYRAVRLT